MFKKFLAILCVTVVTLVGFFLIAPSASADPIDHRDSSHMWCISVMFTTFRTDYTPNELCYQTRDNWITARNAYPYIEGYDYGSFGRQDYNPDGSPGGVLVWVAAESCQAKNHFAPTMPPGWNDFVNSSQTAPLATGCSNFYHWDNYNYQGTRLDCGYGNPCDNISVGFGGINTSSEQFRSNVT